MRHSIASVALLAAGLAACADSAPTSPTTVAVGSPRSVDLQRAGTSRPFSGSCTLTFNAPSFPLPAIHHQIDTGTCRFTHLGLTDFYGELDINFAAGWPGVEWLIVGTAGDEPEVRNWRIDPDGTVTETEVEVTADAGV